MPKYDYLCKNCGAIEVEQKITEDPLKQCPVCSGTEIKKLISISNFHLKGTGWFKTDYSNNKKETNVKTKNTKAD